MSTVAQDLITFDDFCALVKDGQKADLIDGVIYMASPDSRRANRLAFLIGMLIEEFITERNVGGEVYLARFAFRLSDFDGPEPDVAYVSETRLYLIGEGRMDGGPDVAVEIVTRDSRHRDFVDKRHKYEEARVGEYWIIDPIQQKTLFLRLSDDGRYAPVPLENDRIFRSRLIPGFWLNVEWLLADRLPKARTCLREILGS